ncbi:cellulase family glycosylhydrolase [Patescibacteria group bacterium]
MPELYEKIRPKPKMDWLSTSGNKIVNEKGEQVILRGVNLASTDWGFEKWNPKAASLAIKNWNARVLRIRVNPQEFTDDKTQFFRKIEKQIVSVARRNGIYIILHSFVQNSSTDLPDEENKLMWEAIARHYKDDPLILYDLIPEPHNTTKANLKAAYLGLIPRVRKENPRSLIFVTGLGWGREINSYLEDPMPFDNIVYRSNPYNRAAEFEGLFGKIALTYPVFLGEFGADGHPSMTKDSVADLIDYASKLGLGWTAWNFHSVGCPCLLDDYESFRPSQYGKIVQNALKQQPSSSFIPISQDQDQPGLLIIYDDTFHHGFVEQGWDREIDLQSQELKHEGKYSLKIEFTKGFAGLGLHAYDLVNPTDYTYLEFYLNFDQNQAFDLKVSIDNAEEKSIGEVEVNNYIKPTESSWKQVIIPLTDFNLQDELISGLAIKDASGQPHNPIYIDNIRIRMETL